MRLIILCIALIVFAIYIFNTIFIKRKSLSFFWTYIIIGLLLVNGVAEYNWLKTEQKAYDVTVDVMNSLGPNEGFDVTFNPDVHCERISEAFFNPIRKTWGEALMEEQKIRLSYDACTNLRLVLKDSNWENEKTNEELFAIVTVIHEAVHLVGERDESITQCRSLKELPRVLETLGAPAEQIPVLVERATTQTQTNMPPEYRGGVC